MKKGNWKTRALATKDADRIYNDIPLITDETELITPDIAKGMLVKNKKNRPINWNKVEEFTKSMEAGEWKLHSQGIILDEKGNILTGQKRLWAVIYSNTSQYMRISRGCPSDAVNFIDRGSPQTPRDLASRRTERKHAPTEVSMARAILAINGIIRPSYDKLSDIIIEYSDIFSEAIRNTKGLKKTKTTLMILAAICYRYKQKGLSELKFGTTEFLSKRLEKELLPMDVDRCWNKGAAFTLAMEKALRISADT